MHQILSPFKFKTAFRELCWILEWEGNIALLLHGHVSDFVLDFHFLFSIPVVEEKFTSFSYGALFLTIRSSGSNAVSHASFHSSSFLVEND
jgi:hypothetical protein